MHRSGGGKVVMVNCPDLFHSKSNRVVLPVADLPPDALTVLHALNPARYPVLLQSVVTPLAGDGYDILMAFPGERLTLSAAGTLYRDNEIQPHSGFLPSLDAWWQSLRQDTVDARIDDLPFTGGWFLYLGYELAGEIEPRLRLARPANACVAQAIRMPAALIRHAASGRAWIVVEWEFAHCAKQLQADVDAARATPLVAPESPITARIDEDPPEIYLAAVRRALEYIAAGDVYQANLSRAWRVRLPAPIDPVNLYRRLCRANPAPFAGIAALEWGSVISSSPERLLEVRNGWVNTRPIAGTRPRSTNELQDRSLLHELRAHPKEQAEHVMLLDLERNDLGRICQRGTVVVDEYMTLESYAHVHHLVSSVRGKLRADVTPGQAIAAVFPGGTITGCPKVRCMEIIAELEKGPRGAYTGSMGFLNCDGSMDLNILIRTLTLQGSEAVFRAGAGIVADSLPQRELEETRAKALGMIRAFDAEQWA